jgi:hypothetical protein
MDESPRVATHKECANHICSDVDKSAEIQCPLCLGAAYCSEACRSIDWVRHACPNASLVTAREVSTPFVPYWGEEALAQEEIAKLPSDSPVLQSWAVTTRLPNDTMVQSCVRSLLIGRDVASIPREVPPNFLRGEAPPDQLLSREYYVYITRLNPDGTKSDGDAVIMLSGLMGTDAVYEGNSNARIQKLFGKGKGWRPSDLGLKFASKISPKGHHVVIWPDPQNLINFDNESFNVVGSRIRIELSDKAAEYGLGIPDDAHVIRIEGPLDLSSAAKQHGALGALGKQWSARMRAKFRGTPTRTESLAQMYGYRATVDDVTVHLIFRVARNAVVATLADVELEFAPEHFTSGNLRRVNINEQSIPAAVALECNPRSVEDVTALAMGLELRLTKARLAGEPVDAALDNAAGMVRKHARALMEGKVKLAATDDVPMDVNTAIYVAVNAL